MWVKLARSSKLPAWCLPSLGGKNRYNLDYRVILTISTFHSVPVISRKRSSEFCFELRKAFLRNPLLRMTWPAKTLGYWNILRQAWLNPVSWPRPGRPILLFEQLHRLFQLVPTFFVRLVVSEINKKMRFMPGFRPEKCVKRYCTKPQCSL